MLMAACYWQSSHGIPAQKDLQYALDLLSAACDQAGMKLSTEKTKVLCFSRNPSQCALQVSGKTQQQIEKFKYLVVVFTSDGRGIGRLIHESVKQMQFCMSFNALCSQNESFQAS